jgi:hypothetical protein
VNTILSAGTTQGQNTLTQFKTEAEASVAELKMAIKAQLAMQAISTAGVLFLCYLAWEESNRKRS